jgi:hypothetical protein
MQDCGNDGGVATAIPAPTYLRRNELLEGGWEFYGDDWRHHLSIEAMYKPAYQVIGVEKKARHWPRFVPAKTSGRRMAPAAALNRDARRLRHFRIARTVPKSKWHRWRNVDIYL